LLRKKLIKREDIGLTIEQNYTDFKTLPREQLQLISDFIIEKFRNKIEPKSEDKVSSTLQNGYEIQIPKWYFEHEGHELEKILLELYPSLKEIKKNSEEKLKLYVIDHLADEIPQVFSSDIVALFKQIQEA
jgi:uncharacterized pyridoxamine 5'-phosphate oxidase family protein